MAAVRRIISILILLLISETLADNLTVAFEWKVLDFLYPSEDARREAISSSSFIPENNIPVGVEVSGDRLFMTIPRWKNGVPASLAYISLNSQYYYILLKEYNSKEKSMLLL